MATLSDENIKGMVSQGQLISEGFSEESLTPNGYDLRIRNIRHGEMDRINASISPGEHFLVSTIEYMNLPDTIIGQIWIRSSFARRGIIGSFGAVDAGFRGNLTLSFYNAGHETLEFAEGERIAQVVFHRLENSAEKTYSEHSGSFQDSRGISVKGRS